MRGPDGVGGTRGRANAPRRERAQPTPGRKQRGGRIRSLRRGPSLPLGHFSPTRRRSRLLLFFLFSSTFQCLSMRRSAIGGTMCCLCPTNGLSLSADTTESLEGAQESVFEFCCSFSVRSHHRPPHRGMWLRQCAKKKDSASDLCKHCAPKKKKKKKKKTLKNENRTSKHPLTHESSLKSAQ